MPMSWEFLNYMPLALGALLAAYVIYRLIGALDLYAAPSSTRAHFGLVTIPEGDVWTVVRPSGKVSQLHGPTTAALFGARLTPMRLVVASEKEYLRVQFRDGHTEILRGPTSMREDPTIHADVRAFTAVSLASSELIVVYRKGAEDDGSHALTRELVIGPCLYMPRCASEYTHDFSWHGHDPSGDAQGLCRKKPHALRFTKLRNTPMQTYIDVENARTCDDALLTIRLMLFFKIDSVTGMLDATNDPIAELINAVSSDIIEFTAAGSFETFKDSAEQLNSMAVYKNLAERCALIGLSVSKVVFRGFIAPQRLQKMHDDAIERRTRLVLERESEVQEQSLQDERLAHEQERSLVQRKMAKEKAQHDAELRLALFEQEQAELTAAAVAELARQNDQQAAEIAHLQRLQDTLSLRPSDMSALLVARTQGAPAKLIQITGSGGQGTAPIVQLLGEA